MIYLLLPLVAFLHTQRFSNAIASNLDESLLASPTFTLANNITVPLVGFGTASGVGYLHTFSAINAGYRYIDTAQSASWGYKESEVGSAVYDTKSRWEDWRSGDTDKYVFVQTKIHPQNLGYKSTKDAIALSLSRLQVTSLDSVLLHKPNCWDAICDHEPEGTWEDSWKALEEAYDSGLVRSIGICDVDNHLLDKLLTKRVKPTIIQNWFDPFHQDKKLRRRIEAINKDQEEQGVVENKILYQGYSTLGTQWMMKGYKENPVFSNYVLKNISKKHRASVPQVIIQWATRQGVMVLPASTNSSHIESNLNSFFFILTDDEMEEINKLDGQLSGKPRQKSFAGNSNENGVPERNPNAIDVNFMNAVNAHLKVFWVSNEEGEKNHVLIGEMENDTDRLSLNSFHNHEFVVKDLNGRVIQRVLLNKDDGRRQYFKISDRGEL